MQKYLIVAVILFGLGYWLNDFVRGGGLEKYLDEHPNPAFNSQLEYYWGRGLELAARTDSACYRYKRVFEKYPDTENAPLALDAYIELLDSRNTNRSLVLEYSKKFLEKYPNHPKAELIKRKIEIIKQNM
jgi:hypothetical protein